MSLCFYSLLLSIPPVESSPGPSPSCPPLALIISHRLISLLVYLQVYFTAEALFVLKPGNKSPLPNQIRFLSPEPLPQLFMYTLPLETRFSAPLLASEKRDSESV